MIIRILTSAFPWLLKKGNFGKDAKPLKMGPPSFSLISSTSSALQAKCTGFHRLTVPLSSRKVLNYLNHFIIDSLPLLQGDRVGVLNPEECIVGQQKLSSFCKCASRKPISVHCLVF